MLKAIEQMYANRARKHAVKREALAAFLECASDELEDGYDDDSFCNGNAEYRVLTDSEADKACADYVADSLWAFNADFLADATGFDSSIFAALSEKCESGNELIRPLVDKSCGMAELTAQAISADGRGHFLSHYDGNENASGAYFIYRTN